MQITIIFEKMGADAARIEMQTDIENFVRPIVGESVLVTGPSKIIRGKVERVGHSFDWKSEDPGQIIKVYVA